MEKGIFNYCRQEQVDCGLQAAAPRCQPIAYGTMYEGQRRNSRGVTSGALREEAIITKQAGAIKLPPVSLRFKFLRF